MLQRFISWLTASLTNFVSRKPVCLAISRRYVDANGSYVGELYMLQTFAGQAAYRMIGVSLDTLPLDYPRNAPFILDTRKDFLATMPLGTIRVGALDPLDNDNVRRMVGKLSHGPVSLEIQNRFVEHVMERKSV